MLLSSGPPPGAGAPPAHSLNRRKGPLPMMTLFPTLITLARPLSAALRLLALAAGFAALLVAALA